MKESVIVCVALSCFGCAEQSAPVRAAPTDKHEPASLAVTDKSPQRGVINISEDIRRACGITDAEAYFRSILRSWGNRISRCSGSLLPVSCLEPLPVTKCSWLGTPIPEGEVTTTWSSVAVARIR